jgi:hypothetical protein
MELRKLSTENIEKELKNLEEWSGGIHKMTSILQRN